MLFVGSRGAESFHGARGSERFSGRRMKWGCELQKRGREWKMRHVVGCRRTINEYISLRFVDIVKVYFPRWRFCVHVLFHCCKQFPSEWRLGMTTRKMYDTFPRDESQSLAFSSISLNTFASLICTRAFNINAAQVQSVRHIEYSSGCSLGTLIRSM